LQQNIDFSVFEEKGFWNLPLVRERERRPEAQMQTFVVKTFVLQVF